MSFIKRIIKGITANILSKAILILERVLFPPLFLYAWGVDVYGEWLLLSSVVAYLAFSDFGGQTYIVNRMTHAYANHDIRLFKKIAHTGLGLFIIFPGVAFTLFIIGLTVVSPSEILKLIHTDRTIVYIVLSILAFQYMFSLPQAILFGIYRSVGFYARGIMLGNILALFRLLFVAGGLILNFSMARIAVLHVIPYVIMGAYAIYDLGKRFPEFELLSLREFDLHLGKSFLKPSLHFLLITISVAVSVQGMVQIVGLTLGAVQVVIFSTIRTIVNTIKQMMTVFTFSTWPEIIRLDARHDSQKLFSLVKIVLRTVLIVMLLFFGVFHYWGEDIHRLWLRGRVEFNQLYLDLFLLYILQSVFWTTLSHILMALNKHIALSRIMLVSSGVTIILAYFGGIYWGLKGVIIALIAGEAALPLWLVPYLMNKYQKYYSLKFFINSTVPVFAGVICILLSPRLALLMALFLTYWLVKSLPVSLVPFSKQRSR